MRRGGRGKRWKKSVTESEKNQLLNHCEEFPNMSMKIACVGWERPPLNLKPEKNSKWLTFN